MGRRGAIALTIGLIAALGGCGGGSADPGPTDDLTRYLPRDSEVVAQVDFEGVKQQLDLGAGEPLPTYDRLNVDISLQRDRTAEADLYDAAALTVAPLFDPATSNVVALGGDRDRDALSKALDTRAITAAAANERGSEGAVTVVRTSQPFEQLARELAGPDYKRDGETLTAIDLDGTSLTDAGDGVIVFGNRGVSTADLVSSPPGGPTDPSRILGEARDVVAVAGSGGSSKCVRAFGGWQDADGGAGQLELVTAGDASGERLDSRQLDLSGGLTLGAPTTEGDSLRLSYSLAHPENSVSPVGDLVGRVATPRLYDCG